MEGESINDGDWTLFSVVLQFQQHRFPCSSVLKLRTSIGLPQMGQFPELISGRDFGKPAFSPYVDFQQLKQHL
jgi:hypothetical protein